MQVILREKIRNLGELGECVNVKPGYARNYLIPHQKALLATKDNVAAFEKQRAALEKEAAEKLAQAQAQAEKMADFILVIKAQAGEGGKLFGSVGTRDIADKAQENGLDIRKHQVRMPHGAIREIGEFPVEIHLHTDVDVEIKVQVEAL